MRGKRGFTFVELLVVVAIIVLVTAMSAGPMSRMLKARGVSGAARAVQAKLFEARSYAATTNRPVELHFDSEASSMTLYRTVGTAPEIELERASRPVYLPANVYFDEPPVSRVIGQGKETTFEPVGICIAFLPTGSLDPEMTGIGPVGVRLHRYDTEPDTYVSVLFASGLPKVRDIGAPD